VTDSLEQIKEEVAAHAESCRKDADKTYAKKVSPFAQWSIVVFAIGLIITALTNYLAMAATIDKRISIIEYDQESWRTWRAQMAENQRLILKKLDQIGGK
jgi:hypothetical protein